MSRQSLEAELEHLKELNTTVDLLLDTVRSTLTKIHTIKGATDSTAVLLDDWIRILNQTQFTQAVLKDPQWQGPESDDVEPVDYSRREATLEAELREIEAENDRLASTLQRTEDQLQQRQQQQK